MSEFVQLEPSSNYHHSRKYSKLSSRNSQFLVSSDFLRKHQKLARNSLFHNESKNSCYNLILLLTFSFCVVSSINFVDCLSNFSSFENQSVASNLTATVISIDKFKSDSSLSNSSVISDFGVVAIGKAAKRRELTTSFESSSTTAFPFATDNLDACYASLRLVSNKQPKQVPAYNILNNSLICQSNYRETVGNEDDSQLPACDPGLLKVDINPEVAWNVGNTFPHVRLNISATVYAPANSVMIRLECLYAPDHEDTYCHDSSRMLVQGQWIWPCRSIAFEDSKDVEIPFRFGFGCFRMYGMSQYLINVTVLPQKCRSSIYVASPQDMQLFPQIAQLYKNFTHTIGWSPMLLVDMTDQDGIWIRVNGPEDYLARRVSTVVFQRMGNSTSGPLSQVATFELEYPNGGVKWHNVPKGDYMLYSYVPRHDCLLVCDQSDAKCIICPHTHINLTVVEDKLSLVWRSLRTIRDSGPMFLLGILVSCILVLIFGMLYIFRQRRRAATRTCDLQLMCRPSVLLVYSDDCPIHSSIVSSIARLLSTSANANVRLDQNELNTAGMQPSRWLVDSLSSSSRVLIVLSPCTPLVLSESLRLSQRRPYPDLFMPAFDIILRECTRNPLASRSRFATLRLPYSPQTPPQLDILGLNEFKVPAELSRLTAFIHQLDAESPVQLNINNEAMNSVENGITDMETMMRREPNWIEHRREVKDASPGSDDLPSENPNNSSSRLAAFAATNSLNSRALSSTKNASDERFALLPPDEETEENAGKDREQFGLLPPDDDE